jgi:hypothetical protein
VRRATHPYARLIYFLPSFHDEARIYYSVSVRAPLPLWAVAALSSVQNQLYCRASVRDPLNSLYPQSTI